MNVPATLFGGALPGSGAPCQLHFSAGLLVVTGALNLQVPAQALKARIGGADDDALLFDWQSAGVHYTALVADRTAQRTLVASAPPELVPQLRRWAGQAGAQRVKWNAVLGTLAALALLLGVVIWQSEKVEAWLASQVSVETEKRLGQSALDQVKSGARLTQKGEAAQAIKEIGARLTQGSRYEYQWYVKQDDSLNAFAMPGGFVVVHTGLLEKTESAEELAGVLAHEVQHIELRHSLQQMIHSAGWAALLAVTLGDVSAITAVLIHQAGNMRHSRKLETEADLEGVKKLVGAGISPSGLATFFKRMAKDMPKGVPLLSSHPASEERVEQIEALVRQNPCDCKPLAYDWPKVRASVAVDE